MSERKMWTPQEDTIIIRLVRENDRKPQSAKWKWSEIADLLQKEAPASKRTGKQCRERWHNQLDPSIIKDKEWSKQQIDALFRLQEREGNKWASIAREMPGRTDNNIKNFFYSSLRRAIRQINQYVAQYKKKSNIKPFKQTILTKILNINDEKYRDKLDIKNDSAVKLANQLKNMLARLSYEHEDKELDETDKNFREKIVRSIQQFNKSCKKRKSKKVQEEEPDFIEEMDQQEQDSERKQIEVHNFSRRKNQSKPKRVAPQKQARGKNTKETIVPQLGKKPSQDKRKKIQTKKSQQEVEVPAQPKVRKRKSEAELLLQQHPALQKIVMSNSSPLKRQIEPKDSLNLSKKQSNYSFIEYDLPDMQNMGMLTRRSSMEVKDFKFFDPSNHTPSNNWLRKDSFAPFEMFEYGPNTNNKQLMGDSLNYQDMRDKAEMGLDKAVSLNESGFLKMFKQASRNE